MPPLPFLKDTPYKLHCFFIILSIILGTIGGILYGTEHHSKHHIQGIVGMILIIFSIATFSVVISHMAYKQCCSNDAPEEHEYKGIYSDHYDDV